MDCPEIADLPNDRFRSQLLNKWRQNRVPLSCTMELDLRCNLHCHHCYRDGEWPPGILETGEVIRILDDIAEAGTLNLLFTGGEIFLRRDFFDIYEHACRLGFVRALFTNGTTITEKIADRLAEMPPFRIDVTLYGYSRETYEKVTGVAGSHAKCYRGVEILLDRGLPLRLKTVAMKTNKHELPDMFRFAESKGVRFKWDAMINPNLNGSREPCNVRLSPEEVVELDDLRPEILEELRDYFESRKEFTTNRLFSCGAGSRTFHVDPYGNMTMCLLMREPRFSLKEMSFRQIWEEEFPAITSRLRRPDHPCNDCNLTTLCSNCPAWSQLEGGDMEARVAFTCEVGHRLAEKLGCEPRLVVPCGESRF
jgi:radical SAM protein with 4Fe4S-binding SPASM domain